MPLAQLMTMSHGCFCLRSKYQNSEMVRVLLESGAVAAEFAGDEIGGGHTPVLRFFEDRETAQVGVCEEDAAMRLGKGAAFGGEDCSHLGTSHGMSDSHDVDAGNALPDVSVHSLQIVQD